MNNDKVREALRTSMYSAANSGWSGDAIAVDIDAAVDVALEHMENLWQPIMNNDKVREAMLLHLDVMWQCVEAKQDEE